jgi:phage nucleotide-binding protein
VSSKKKIWLYAQPFAGKTTLTDKFPDTLILTTDGNINNVTAPYVYIRDEVTVNGRMTSRKFAWEVFKDTIEELEKKQNDFKTISLDLVEDTREMCRLYMYDKLGIQHESDSGYGKGWDVIKTEYISTMRRFFNLDYDNIIICSHEDVTKTITKKSGEQITRIAPNIQEAIATKLAGMVDIVARIIVNDDDSRTISFKTDSVIFGGGRLNVAGREIPCNYDDLMAVYAEAVQNSTENFKDITNKATAKKEPESDSDTSENESVEEFVGQDSLEDQAADEKRAKRTRKSSESSAKETSDNESAETIGSKSADTSNDEEAAKSDTSNDEEEKPKKRTRKKRGE